jgi:predicted DNA-binding transcriptional regulator AlpA
MSQFLTISEVVPLVGLSESSIRRGWYDGTFPKPRRFGRRGNRWLRSELEAWLDNRPAKEHPQKVTAQ